MKSRTSARHAYLEAEVVTGLANQIRALRLQRGWTQSQLAKKLDTTQTVISRMEDPSYGKYSVQTLIELAKAFDIGMHVKFVSFVTMLHTTFSPTDDKKIIPSFDEEAGNVDFYKPSISSAQIYLATSFRNNDSKLVSYITDRIDVVESSGRYFHALNQATNALKVFI